MIPNNILKSNFVAILPTNVKKNTRTAKFFIRFLSVCVLFGGQKYEKQAINMFSWRTIFFLVAMFITRNDRGNNDDILHIGYYFWIASTFTIMISTMRRWWNTK